MRRWWKKGIFFLVFFPGVLWGKVEIESLDVSLADAAYKLGFYSVARDLYQQEIGASLSSTEDKTISPTTRETKILERLVVISMVDGDIATAENLLNCFSEPSDSVSLLKSMLSAACGVPNDALFRSIDVRHLDKNELPWYYLLSAELSERQELFTQSRNDWEEAKRLAVDAQQLKALKEFRAYLAVELSPASDVQEEHLRLKLRDYNWRPAGYPSVKRYAILLYKKGKQKEAQEVLQNQIRHIPEEAINARAEFYILEALLGNVSDPDIQKNLREILQKSSQPNSIEAALRLLLRAAKNPEEQRSLLNFLKELPPFSTESALDESILLAQIELATELEETTLVESLAMEFLLNYPQSTQVEDVQHLWLHFILKEKSPNYEQIAIVLEHMSEFSSEERPSEWLLLALANHYQNLKEWLIAQKLYDHLLTFPNSALRSEILKGKIYNSLAQENIVSAYSYFDNWIENITFLDRKELDLVAAVEANLKTTSQRSNFHTQLLSLESLVNAETENLWRLKYLEAKNFHASGNDAAANELLQPLMSALVMSSNGQKTISEELTAAILSLKVQLLLAGNYFEEAQFLFDRLRREFPLFSSTQEAYFSMVRVLSQDNPEAAIALLKEFLSIYEPSYQGGSGDDAYLPLALLELANVQHNLDSVSSEQVLETLERLYTTYPDSLYAYYARFQQANILREQHDFIPAAAIYEYLLRQFPHHRDTYLTEFYLAKCELALANGKPSKSLNSALNLLEKLHASKLQDAAFRLEVDFTYAFALGLNHQRAQQQAVLWAAWNEYFPDNSSVEKLSISGQFWLHAIGEKLLQILDPQLDRGAIQRVEKYLQELLTKIHQN